MPRVVILSRYPILRNRIGGMDRFFWALDEEMRRAGWTARWLFPEAADSGHYLDRGLCLTMLPSESLLQASESYLSRNGGADLLVSHFVEYDSRYTLGWKRAGVRRYLAVAHMSRPAVRLRLRRRLRAGLKRAAAYPFVDGVIAVSGFVGQEILGGVGRLLRRKVFVVPNGVDPGVYHPNGASGHRVPGPLHLVLIAHLTEQKGVHLFLEALQAARPHMPEFTVSIAGSGPYEGTLQALTRKLALSRHVYFLGNINSQAELLRSADISVVPSLWQEACPFSVLETMASGVPLVASRLGGIPELVGEDSALLVTPGDVTELAAALVRLGNDSLLRERLGRAGFARASREYTLHKMVGGHMELMRNTLTGTERGEVAPCTSAS
jgi:glycosyltransferase involved in cell wall biosynthesis